jgi:RND superfamily putative drug exporter
MTKFLEKYVVAYPILWILIWVGALTLLLVVSPSFNSIVQTGEFGYLPDSAPTRKAEKIFKEGFQRDLLGSLVVIVVKRESRPQGLITDEELAQLKREDKVSDFEFVETILKPRLEELVTKVIGQGLVNEQKNETKEAAISNKDTLKEPNEKADSQVVRTYTDPAIGALLTSEDNKATLVTIELTNDFLDYRNAKLIEECERLIDDDKLKAKSLPGLDLWISGSATVGRDMNVANAQSAKATESLTVVLVIGLLIWIYRAPLLAFIPLLAIGLSLKVAITLVALLADYKIIGAFAGMNVYMTVVTYGAGIDYCLFLIARYRELLNEGHSVDDALNQALKSTAFPLIASAGTSILGIGSMVFAVFGKFREAGVGISIGLAVALLASLTLAPAMLRLTGRYAFWPKIHWERPSEHTRWWNVLNPIPQSMREFSLEQFWHATALNIVAAPARFWNYSVLVMLPFVIVAIASFEQLSYGLISELPKDALSVVGTKAVQEHFPAGTTGPTTVLLYNPDLKFDDDEVKAQIELMTNTLIAKMPELGLADIRSFSHPFGVTVSALENARKNEARLDNIKNPVRKLLEKGLYNKRILAHYVATFGQYENHVTRMDLVLNAEPFSQESLKLLDKLQLYFQDNLPPSLKTGTQVSILGSTASIRDLKHVTDQDQIRIDILVLGLVYVVLVLLLHQPATSFYLIVSVFFSYLVTLGVTFTFFWALDPVHFPGLDWKVRMFLFVILIAIGEDYNIFLISRYEEERKKHGPIQGIIEALTKTGSVISSCGLIMAGTFGTLMAGSISGMVQLGFALAFGILLDTFVIRPILVPCYIVLLHQGRFGELGKYLGSEHQVPDVTATDSPG